MSNGSCLNGYFQCGRVMISPYRNIGHWEYDRDVSASYVGCALLISIWICDERCLFLSYMALWAKPIVVIGLYPNLWILLGASNHGSTTLYPCVTSTGPCWQPVLQPWGLPSLSSACSLPTIHRCCCIHPAAPGSASAWSPTAFLSTKLQEMGNGLELLRLFLSDLAGSSRNKRTNINQLEPTWTN